VLPVLSLPCAMLPMDCASVAIGAPLPSLCVSVPPGPLAAHCGHRTPLDGRDLQDELPVGAYAASGHAVCRADTASPDEPDAEETALRDMLSTALARLPAEEAAVLRALYGIAADGVPTGDSGASRAAVSGQLGTSLFHVQRLQAAGLARLAQHAGVTQRDVEEWVFERWGVRPVAA
jgi:hypothetical protein